MIRRWPEKRIAPRHRIKVKVRYWNDTVKGEAVSRDISATGVFLETEAEIPGDARLHLEFSLRSGPFLAEGRVTRIVHGRSPTDVLTGFGVGLRLLRIIDELPASSAPSR